MGVTPESLNGALPEVLFFAFQMTFAIITPALIVGAYAERVGFGFVLLFSGFWMLVVYAPVAHWIWGGGMLSDGGIFGAVGVRDFAGGIVVLETTGLAALMIAIALGPRKHKSTPPHNPGLVMIGAGMLWVGWFGFNGGSALAANGQAAMAITLTHLSAAAASLSWALWEDHPGVGLCGAAGGAAYWRGGGDLVPGGGADREKPAEDRRYLGRFRGARHRRHLWHDHDGGAGCGLVERAVWRARHRRGLDRGRQLGADQALRAGPAAAGGS